MKLLLGWLVKADPTVALLLLAGIILILIALCAVLVILVICGKKKYHKRVVSVLKAIGEMLADARG
ncbi:hypothetical protein [Rathayibacter sp. VKM Ac-2760]|uniref:hypothetical protein n=1 Tax=Rathayibacter sp. VKM Ac-2760 TaxID=2609253 RepID=UPI001316CB01|nr:hypothetical protein [Rathayibacter sp. VKM Ac-2760]QHC60988.1 hypothetical protein GSU72_19885 [Rathayibacter sp. VKM Ac-2760]